MMIRYGQVALELNVIIAERPNIEKTKKKNPFSVSIKMKQKMLYFLVSIYVT